MQIKIHECQVKEAYSVINHACEAAKKDFNKRLSDGAVLGASEFFEVDYDHLAVGLPPLHENQLLQTVELATWGKEFV